MELVKVIHGANDDEFPIAGVTVDCVRRNLADAFNIPDEAIALVNGDFVHAAYRLLPDDTLEFVNRRGEKSILDPDERAQMDRIEAILNRIVGETAEKGLPGRRAETVEVGVFITALRKQGKTWKEVLKSCREKWPDDEETVARAAVAIAVARIAEQSCCLDLARDVARHRSSPELGFWRGHLFSLARRHQTKKKSELNRRTF